MRDDFWGRDREAGGEVWKGSTWTKLLAPLYQSFLFIYYLFIDFNFFIQLFYLEKEAFI